MIHRAWRVVRALVLSLGFAAILLLLDGYGSSGRWGSAAPAVAVPPVQGEDPARAVFEHVGTLAGGEIGPMHVGAEGLVVARGAYLLWLSPVDGRELARLALSEVVVALAVDERGLEQRGDAVVGGAGAERLLALGESGGLFVVDGPGDGAPRRVAVHDLVALRRAESDGNAASGPYYVPDLGVHDGFIYLLNRANFIDWEVVVLRLLPDGDVGLVAAVDVPSLSYRGAGVRDLAVGHGLLTILAEMDYPQQPHGFMGQLLVADLTRPHVPVSAFPPDPQSGVRPWWLPVPGNVGIAWAGERLLLLQRENERTRAGAHAFALVDPRSAQVVGGRSLSGRPRAVAAGPERAWVLHDAPETGLEPVLEPDVEPDAWVQALDLSDPTAPRGVGVLRVASDARRIAVAGGAAWLGLDGGRIEARSLRTGHVTAGVPGVGAILGVAADGERVAATVHEGGGRIALLLLSAYDDVPIGRAMGRDRWRVPDGVLGTAAAGGRIYVASGDCGLHVLRTRARPAAARWRDACVHTRHSAPRLRLAADAPARVALSVGGREWALPVTASAEGPSVELIHDLERGFQVLGLRGDAPDGLSREEDLLHVHVWPELPLDPAAVRVRWAGARDASSLDESTVVSAWRAPIGAGGCLSFMGDLLGRMPRTGPLGVPVVETLSGWTIGPPPEVPVEVAVPVRGPGDPQGLPPVVAVTATLGGAWMALEAAGEAEGGDASERVYRGVLPGWSLLDVDPVTGEVPFTLELEDASGSVRPVPGRVRRWRAALPWVGAGR